MCIHDSLPHTHTHTHKGPTGDKGQKGEIGGNGPQGNIVSRLTTVLMFSTELHFVVSEIINITTYYSFIYDLFDLCCFFLTMADLLTTICPP